MLNLLLSLGLVLTVATAPPSASVPPAGGKVPEFNATKWYNSPPLTLEDLKGKAVLLQVFRTW